MGHLVQKPRDGFKNSGLSVFVRGGAPPEYWWSRRKQDKEAAAVPWMMSCEWLYFRRYSGERRVLITDGIR